MPVFQFTSNQMIKRHKYSCFTHFPFFYNQFPQTTKGVAQNQGHEKIAESEEKNRNQRADSTHGHAVNNLTIVRLV